MTLLEQAREDANYWKSEAEHWKSVADQRQLLLEKTDTRIKRIKENLEKALAEPHYYTPEVVRTLIYNASKL
jgi:hypothetical protein